MELETTIAVLRNWDEITLEKLITRMNNQSIVSDVEGTGVSSTMIERWTESCDEYLRERGYTGGKIMTHGGFYDNHGAIHVIFNSRGIYPIFTSLGERAPKDF